MERIYTETSALNNILKALTAKQSNTTPFVKNLNIQVKAFLVLFILMFIVLGTQAETYYSKTTGNVNSTLTWGQNSDGNGTAPSNFTTSGDIFILRSESTLDMANNNNWIIGSGVRLNVYGKLISSNNSVTVTINGTIELFSQAIRQISLTGNSTVFTLGNSNQAKLITANQYGIYGNTLASINAKSYVMGTNANYEFNGASQSMAGLPATVNNLTCSGSGTKTRAANITVSVILTIAPGVTLDMVTNALTGVASTSGTGTLKTQHATAPHIPINKNWSFTVDYNRGGVQTVSSGTYTNLTLSGSDLKTTTAAVTVNGILSMEGTATASVAPTYGTNATLQYNTAINRTAGPEWITPFTATGGVIIENKGAITLNGAKEFGLGSPLTINIDAKLITGNSALTFGGNFASAGTFTAGSSNITINNTKLQTISGFTTTGDVTMSKTSNTATIQGIINAKSLIINGGSPGTLNLGDGFTHSFTGPITLTAGTLNAGNSIINVATTTNPAWTNASGVFAAATGTVNFSANGAQSITGTLTTFNNLTLSGSGLKTLATVPVVNGVLSMEGTATVSVAPTFGSSATLQYKGTDSRDAGPEFPAEFSGTGGLIIDQSGNTITLNSDKTSLAGNLNIKSGTLDLAGYTANRAASGGTLTIADGATLKIGGANSLPSNYSTHSIGNTSTVEYSGTAQTVSDFNSSQTYGNLILSGSGTKTLASGISNIKTNFTIDGLASATTVTNLKVDGDLTIGNSAVLTIAPGTSITLLPTGSISNLNGINGLIIKCNTSGVSGSLIHYNSGVRATVERYINAWSSNLSGWHLLSTPVSDQAIADGFTDATPANYDFYAWDEVSDIWLNQKVAGNNITSFSNGKGYLVAYAVAGTKNFTGGTTGTLNVSDIPCNLTNNTSTINHGWNLLGNPFPCALLWGTSNWALSPSIAQTAKIWKESTASYVDISSGTGIIPAMNGFMVQVVNPANTGTLKIPFAARTNDYTPFYKSSNGNTIKLIVHDTLNKTAQESIINLNESASDSFDNEFDSHFLPGFAPQFYSLYGEEKLSTNTLPGLFNREIQLGFVKNDATNFNIELLTENLDPNLAVFLTDKKTGTITRLSSNPIYTFTSSASDDSLRFMLSFEDASSISFQEAAKNFTIVVDNGTITINQLESMSGKVKVSDMLGRTVAMENLVADTPLKINLNSVPGVYVVTVYTKSKTYSQKVVIR